MLAQAFCKVVEKLPTPAPCADAPSTLPPPLVDAEALLPFAHGIPSSVEALGYPAFPKDDAVVFRGGESAGLARLEAQLVRCVSCGCVA
jgi:hypothetical protein